MMSIATIRPATTVKPAKNDRAGNRTSRPAPPLTITGSAPAAPTFGDRPAVVVAVWITLSLLFFVGTWLGSLAP